MSFDCDVVVIGGGPSGSTAAAALARSGRRVVPLERDAFPRFHIGESLLASVNDVLDAIGAADLVREAAFPRKWGATFMTPDGRVERFADFAVSSEVPQPQTWQVRRDRFDEMLLRNAAACGADVRERHKVVDITLDRDGVSVTYRAVAAAGAAVSRLGCEPDRHWRRATARTRARRCVWPFFSAAAAIEPPRG